LVTAIQEGEKKVVVADLIIDSRIQTWNVSDLEMVLLPVAIDAIKATPLPS
jgi:hypothetical protein